MTPHLSELELYNILKITNEDVYIDFPLCFPCIFEEPSNGCNFGNINGIGLIFSKIEYYGFLRSYARTKIKNFCEVKKKFFLGYQNFCPKIFG